MFKKLIVLGLLAGCAGAPPAPMWTLTELKGRPVSVPITLDFTSSGIKGTGPCNAYSATQTGSGTFPIGPVSATKASCPDIALEQEYFEALGLVATSDIGPSVLVLNDSGSLSLARFRKTGP